MGVCLSEDEVVEFVSGRLSREQYSTVEQHLTECRVCLALVARTASAVMRPGQRDDTTPDIAREAVAVAATMDSGPKPIECRPGLVIAGRYQLDRLLGQGGMGAVWAARQLEGGRRVAVKVLRGISAARSDARRRFMREARAASAVSHAHVVEIFELVELEDGAPAIVMDLLDGESLRQRLQRTKLIGLTELAGLMVPVISAVGTAHAVGIVHRDLKPDNIFLSTADGTPCPKVLDFGVAKLTATEGIAAQTEGLTETGDMLGTPYYMAPEQAFGETDINHRSDVWALGVILYECLIGDRPFRGDNLGQLLKRITTATFEPLDKLAPELPRDVVELVTRMLARERVGRPVDLHEVQEVLMRHTEVRAPEFGPALSLSGEHAAPSDSSPPASGAAVPSSSAAAPAPPKRTGLWLALAASACAALGLAAWRIVESMSKPPVLAPAALPAVASPAAASPAAAPPAAVTPVPAAVVPPPAAVVPSTAASPTAVAAPAGKTRRKAAHAPPPAASPGPAAPTEPAHKRGDVVKEVPF